MLIGINLLYLIPGKVGGTETYARELIPRLAKVHKLIIICGKEAAMLFSGLKNVTVISNINSSNRFARIFLEQTYLPWMFFLSKVDVIFSLGYSSPFIHHCPSVVTVHDLNWYYHPEDFSTLSYIIWKYLTIFSVLTANHIITDSISSKNSIVNILKVPQRKVTSIMHGVPTRIKPVSRFQINKPYLLTVIAGYPHKNLSTLLKAFAKLSKSHKKIRLLVCGLNGRADRSNLDILNQLRIKNKIDILGYITREKLASLYKNAELFVFPSAYEGFGYPVLEAMSYGIPVVSSNAFSLQEVVGSGGVLVDPYDVDGYVVAIENLLNSSKAKSSWIKRGSIRAKELNWKITTRETLLTLNTIVSTKNTVNSQELS